MYSKNFDHKENDICGPKWLEGPFLMLLNPRKIHETVKLLLLTNHRETYGLEGRFKNCKLFLLMFVVMLMKALLWFFFG